MGSLGTVLILDDCDDLLVLMKIYSDRLCGRTTLTAKSLQDLIALGDQVFSCPLAILDINLGPNQPTGVEAYRWLRDHGYQGAIYFLTGHARSSPLVGEAERIGDAKVLAKPLAPEVFKKILGAQGDLRQN